MKYWWVNQNQTYKQETEGGYIWSPKVRKDSGRNTFYDNMRRVSPGDILFSFYRTKIPCIGIITSHGYHQNKPEFGKSGAAWSAEGWMVNVDYKPIMNAITPKKHMDIIGPLLPSKYSPLQSNGNGNQGVYLAKFPDPIVTRLLTLIGDEVQSVIESTKQHAGRFFSDIDAEEDRIER